VDQQEFCDLASMELVVKSEDVDAIEYELQQIRYSGGFLSNSEKAAILGTTAQLDDFLNKLVTRLQQQRFFTPTLESQRLNLLNEAGALHGRSLLCVHQIDMS
jgi:hypothetical protein